jgi:hypothetical protein
MPGFGQYYADAQLNLLSNGSAIPAPAQMWVRLHVGDPSTAGTANVTTYTNYAPQQITSGQWGAISTVSDGRQRSNAVAINFPANGNVGAVTFTHYTLWDASSGGNLLYVGDINPDKTVASNDVPTFSVGDLTIKVKYHF